MYVVFLFLKSIYPDTSCFHLRKYLSIFFFGLRIGLAYNFYILAIRVEDCTKLREYEYISGLYTIYPSKHQSEGGLEVFCNMTNGGWTVKYTSDKKYKICTNVATMI